MRFARARKAITAALGMAITLVLLVPEETIPEQWRPWIGVLLAVGTVAGVYRVSNARPNRDELLRRLNERPVPPRQDDVAGPPRRHLKGDRPIRGDHPRDVGP